MIWWKSFEKWCFCFKKSSKYIHSTFTILINTDFALGNSLFESVKLTEKTNRDNYKYSGYDIRFHSHLQFLWTSFIILGVDNSSSVHLGDKNKNILVLGEGPRQELDNTAKYPTNFTEQGKKLVLNLQYNGSNSFLFVNATNICQVKA